MADTFDTTTGTSVERGGIAETDLPSVVRRWAGAFSLGRNMQASNARSTTQRWARALVHGHLKKMQRGSLVLKEVDGETFHFGTLATGDCKTVADSNPVNRFQPAHAVIEVADPAAYTAIALNGVVGAAEGFMDGYWATPDLLSVIRFFVSNINALKRMDQERSVGNRIALSVLSRITRNSLSGSRKNISAHYDLGNDFFELFLDPSMMYSAALFNNKEISLAEASNAKLELICDKLELKPTDHLLEIGTGWGGMALYAARNIGCQVTTTTISKQQYEYTTALINEGGPG